MPRFDPPFPRCAVALAAVLSAVAFVPPARAQTANDVDDHKPSATTGNLGGEVVAGVGGVAVATLLAAGAGLLALNSHSSGLSFEYAASLQAFGGTYLVGAPLLASLAVTLAGNGSGGNGRGESTVGGATVGTFAGLGMATALWLLPIEREAYVLRFGVGCALVVAGPVVGAVIGYRASATSPVRAIALPTLDGRGAMFMLSGAM